MTETDSTVAQAVADAHRHGWAFVLAATVRFACDLDLAEECAQEAYVAALDAWTRQGVPRSPTAWLTVTARRKATDVLRRERAFRQRLPLLIEPDNTATDDAAAEIILDDRLRLIFTCCHPALAQEAQVALTLRLICGVSTADVSQAFLVSEPTMAARLTRAKKKISASRIPYRVPSAEDLPERLHAVLTVIHLLFTTGHTAPSGGQLVRVDLMESALDLARMLRVLLPTEPEVAGLLALILVNYARRAARTDDEGRLLLLAEQDRLTWDRVRINEGHQLVVTALTTGGPPGRFALQAAIAALHAQAESYERTDWPQILTLYDELLKVWRSPVVALNRAAALSMVTGPNAALAEVEELERDGRLAGYRYVPAMKADLLRRLGRRQEAASAYQAALELSENEAERAFLSSRLAESTSP